MWFAGSAPQRRLTTVFRIVVAVPAAARGCAIVAAGARAIFCDTMAAPAAPDPLDAPDAPDVTP